MCEGEWYIERTLSKRHQIKLDLLIITLVLIHCVTLDTLQPFSGPLNFSFIK